MVRGILALGAMLSLAIAGAVLAAPPPEDYGKLPGMDFVTLSPSGARYAFVATSGGVRRLFVATTQNQPIESDGFGSLKVEGIAWAGDDHLLIETSSTVHLGVDFEQDQSELGGVIVVDLAHHKAFSVFGGAYEKRVAHTVVGTDGVANIGGHWYGFFEGYGYELDKAGGRLKTSEDGRLYPDLFRVDLDTGDLSLAARGQENISGWLISPTGEVSAKLTYTEKSGDWRLTPARGGALVTAGTAPTGRMSLLGYGRTADDVLIRLAGKDHDEVQDWPLGGGAMKSSFNHDDLGMTIHDPTTDLWIGNLPFDQDKAPELFDPADQAKVHGAFKAFPGYLVHLVSWSGDFNRMIVRTDGGDDSGTYWIVDIKKGSADVLGAEYPTVRAADVGKVSWLDYKAADGLAMHGVLTLPPDRPAKSLPLVVIPHGGPEAHDHLGFDYWAQAFAARGYAVFQPNFRGSNGSGNAFRDAGFGQWGRKMQTDISDGVAELARRGVVDPKRACIVGGSYGGYAALAGVTLQQGLYRCAVSYGGVTDLPSFLIHERVESGYASSTMRYWKEFIGVSSGADLRPLSPAALADRADAPILLVHGKDDTVVPIEQSELMERNLKRAGKPVELITLPGADHWLLEEPARVAWMKASVEFVLKNNPPDAAPAAVAAK